MRRRADTTTGDLFDAPFERGMAASRASARRWSKAQRLEVREAIRWCSQNHAAFTADQVYQRLGPGFPVTKGMAAQFIWAMGEGLVVSTGKTVIAARGGKHDHAQRLTLWRPA